MTSFSETIARKTRVLVADDSDLMRSLLVEIIGSSMDFRVVAEARTGYEAIRLLHEVNPDVVTLDLQMPDLGGLDTLGYIMSEAPRPVIIVSSHVADQAKPALDALEYGALDVVAKPAGDEARDVDILGDRLMDALRAAASASVGNLQMRRRVDGVLKSDSKIHGKARSAIAIAASTGGPRALAEVVPRLPAALPSAILIVQHMPATFTKAFAERLASLSAAPVKEAVDGEIIQAGTVYIAPGGVHMSLKRTADGIAISLEDTDPLWGVRPAADILFNAVAKHFGPASAGVVLTGMGRDGADGLRAIHEVGGWTAVQDAESCVVYGMPRAAAQYADDEISIEQVAEAVAMRSLHIARKRRR
ncbi:MAG TPA: chemotaxis-specific protein-glutamate methyltransferase CheB [Longimicrobiales bacterium]|nr:chemotaxis-specific protein-glutamate methyltransferase CheB [Longimicrobiales bacterium]